MNHASVEKICGTIGQFIKFDDTSSDSNNLRTFMRIRVNVNIQKPFKTGSFFRREDESILWIQYRFKRLSDFCYQCGCLGHAFGSCRTTPKSTEGVLDPRMTFGPWLKVISGSRRDLEGKKGSGTPAETGNKEVEPVELLINPVTSLIVNHLTTAGQPDKEHSSRDCIARGRYGNLYKRLRTPNSSLNFQIPRQVTFLISA